MRARKFKINIPTQYYLSYKAVFKISVFYLLPFLRYGGSKFHEFTKFLFYFSSYNNNNNYFSSTLSLSTTFVPLTFTDFDEIFTKHRAPQGDEKNVLTDSVDPLGAGLEPRLRSKIDGFLLFSIFDPLNFRILQNKLY